MVTVLEGRVNTDLDEKNSIFHGSLIRSNELDVKETDRASGLDLVVPIDESGIDHRSLDYLIKTVKIFSGKLVVVYFTHRLQLPKGFLEYAKAEGIRDYESHYYNSLANEKFQGIAKRAESEGIEWVGHVHIGGIRGAVKHILQGKNVALIAIVSKRDGQTGGSVKGIKMSDLSKLGAPVLVI